MGPRAIAKDVIHDGDTVKLLIDQGFEGRAEKWIRLAGVSAPEISEPGGSTCRAFVIGWLDKRAQVPGGPPPVLSRLRWPLRVVTDKTQAIEPIQVQSFTRYVGWIYDLATGESLNEQVNALLAEHPEWPPGRDILHG
jgi:hypothetical protein